MAKISYDEKRREIKEHGSALFPIAVYETDPNACPIPLHWHDEFEAGVVTGGAVRLTVGSQQYELREGDGFFINAGALHAYPGGGEAPCAQRTFVADASLVGGRTDSVFWHKYCQPLLERQDVPVVVLEKAVAWQRDAADAILRIWRSCRDARAEYEIDTRYQLSHLLYLLCSHLTLRENLVTEKDLRDAQRIKQMLRYIGEHYAGELSVEDIARSALISQSECLRCFHSTIGMTPLHYLRDFRVGKAAAALTATDAPIGDIALGCGFDDVSYFTRVFREAKGVTPGEYRKAGKPDL